MARLRPSAEEISALTACSWRDRYTYFIKRVADWEEAWALDDDGLAMVADDDGQDAVCLWPAKEFATRSKGEDWQAFSAKRIPIDRLIEKTLPKLIKRELMVAVFLVAEHEDNALVPADAVLADLRDELTKYE